MSGLTKLQMSLTKQRLKRFCGNKLQSSRVKPQKVAKVHDKTEAQKSYVATNFSTLMSSLTKLQMSMTKLRLKEFCSNKLQFSHVKPHKVANAHDKTEAQKSSVATNFSTLMWLKRVLQQQITVLHVKPHKVANIHDKTEAEKSSVATNYSIPMSSLTRLQMSMTKLRLKRVM